MNSQGYSSVRCRQIVYSLLSSYDSSYGDLSKYLSFDNILQLLFSCDTEKDTEYSDAYSEPMVWIGIYIALASFFCILAMAADLWHGFRNKKFWFPSKYFSLNAASITVITVAMKLPVDLSSTMPRYVDQATKVGSLGFMCAMMANLMPSLATMDNTTLLANLTGLFILVITLIVNICIQINTSAIMHNSRDIYPIREDNIHVDFVIVAYIYTAMILLLLVLMISSSLTIPSSKEILESKYQATVKKTLTDIRLNDIQISMVEKLRRRVRRYWVMAETGSPQFVSATNPLSTASGIISLVVLLMNLFLAFKVVHYDTLYPSNGFVIPYGSPYKWSIYFIFITQAIGVVVGTIAPISRCFSLYNFKLATKWNRTHFMFFKVEMYWIQKLQEWKQSPIPFLSNKGRSRSLIYNSKDIILSLCIGFQKVIVISCKVISLLGTSISIIVICCLYRWKSLKARWFAPSIASRIGDIDEDLSDYVLRIKNEMELTERTLKRISSSVNSFISKAQKEQNSNLLGLLEKSTGFKGVEIVDTDHVQPLLPIELVNNWSLPIVTLTCIAVALPDIQKDEVENLLRSVGEGLLFTHLMEESLNSANEYVNIWKASLILWHEVENKWKWLDNPLANNVFKGKTTLEIVKWFSNKAEEIVNEIKKSSDEELVENPPKTLIAANAMYRITQAILLRYQSNIEPVTSKQLFADLNGMIADIFSACFTNIPRVITMRCHESVIEKREASVKIAAKLLGKTTKIIERLEACELPSMDDGKMAYIDEWRLYFKQSVP